MISEKNPLPIQQLTAHEKKKRLAYSQVIKPVIQLKKDWKEIYFRNRVG